MPNNVSVVVLNQVDWDKLAEHGIDDEWLIGMLYAPQPTHRRSPVFANELYEADYPLNPYERLVIDYIIHPGMWSPSPTIFVIGVRGPVTTNL